MDTSFSNTLDQVHRAKRDDTDWAAMTTGQRIQALEVEGYCIFPDSLSADQVATIGAELHRLPTVAVDYSEHQRGCPEVEWTNSPRSISLIAHRPMTDFLETLFGDEPLCESCGYSLSEPGHPGIAVHTDSQPYGSKIFGLKASSPVLVRVLYYLDDLTPERSPFKVIPRSHLSLHKDGNPYNRFLRHDGEVMVTCKAGTAVVINQKVFHGNYPNHSDLNRRLLAIAYRPAWAGPIVEVPERDADKVTGLPAEVQKYFKSPNTKDIDYDVPNRPNNLATTAAGIHPDRWNLG